MARSHSLFSTFAALVIILFLPTDVHAFTQCSIGEGPSDLSAAVLNKSASVNYDGIVSLRLRINSNGKVDVLGKGVVDGRWQDNRNIPVGPKLYYEVIDESGSVIARGYRRDPRNMHAGRVEDFLLTTPYRETAASVNIYIMDYENGGKGDYSRDFTLLASVDIRRQMMASVQ